MFVFRTDDHTEQFETHVIANQKQYICQSKSISCCVVCICFTILCFCLGNQKICVYLTVVALLVFFLFYIQNLHIIILRYVNLLPFSRKESLNSQNTAHNCTQKKISHEKQIAYLESVICSDTSNVCSQSPEFKIPQLEATIEELQYKLQKLIVSTHEELWTSSLPDEKELSESWSCDTSEEYDSRLRDLSKRVKILENTGNDFAVLLESFTDFDENNTQNTIEVLRYLQKQIKYTNESVETLVTEIVNVSGKVCFICIVYVLYILNKTSNHGCILLFVYVIICSQSRK